MHSSVILVCATLIGVVFAAETGSLKDGFRCKKDEECQAGLSCIGPPTHLRCKMKKPLGGQCGDPTWVCRDGLDCETKKGQRYGNCVRTMSSGFPCGDKWIRCATGTTCIAGKCSPPAKDGFPCDKDDDCVDGLHCLGKPERRRCKMKKPLGGQCGDPTWVCQSQFKCVTKPGNRYGNCIKTMPEGDPCTNEWHRCAEGTKCVNKKCTKPEYDDDDYNDDDDDCEEPEKPSPSPSPKVPPKDKPETKIPPPKCTPGKKMCPKGLHCVGRKGDEICKKPMYEGESCRDITWVCAKGLECVGKGKNAFCRRPAPPLKKQPEKKTPPPKKKPEKKTPPPKKKHGKPRTKSELKDCRQNPKLCNRKTHHCLMKKGKAMCKKLMKRGESCRDPTWRCAPRLVCVEKGKQAFCWTRKEAILKKNAKKTKKKERKAASKRCGGKCKKGFVCVTVKKVSKCLKRVGKGKKCGWKQKAGWCARGLVCRRRRSGASRCVRYLKVGYKCGGIKYEICRRGAKCGTSLGKRICTTVQ